MIEEKLQKRLKKAALLVISISVAVLICGGLFSSYLSRTTDRIQIPDPETAPGRLPDIILSVCIYYPQFQFGSGTSGRASETDSGI